MMNKALTCLVEALERTPELSVRTLDVLPEAERHLVVNEWNATETDYPSDKCVHELFEDQVSRTPEATAVVFGEESLTYAELNARANRLAHKLLELGVKPDSFVAICVERSLEMIVGLLGILKAGGAYVPLDPSYPKERLQFMLNDCESMVMLTRNNLLENLKDIFSEELTIVDLDQHFEDRPETNTLSNTFTSSHLAYVIYTSGSTGIPKGVMIKHKGVSNQCVASQTLFNLRPGERFLQFANVTFDVSVQEIFSTLISGATVILRTDVRIKGAKSFWEECRNNRITILHLPTRFWQTIINEETVELPDCIRLLVIGGEAVEVKALRNWFKYKCKKPTLFNSYGPTEVTVNATLHTLTHNIGTWRSIGSSINNTRVYILNTHCQPVPVGVIGELYIGGAGVARGYLNRPELTEERFLADPFCGDPDSRMYKTGDLGRWLPDGTIEFLGRNDFQVKIRGFRIELGEIESRLLDHSDVREAVVIAREDEPGDKRLIAYVVSSVDLTAAKLRDHLSEYLPEYMVPSAFVTLESLPLTPNGKLDRKALPAPDGTSYITQEYEAPLGEVETKVAAIWEEVLSVERVGRHDNFFELGGHSLLAVKMIERMRRLGLNADVRTLFNTPTLLGLAAATGSGVTEVTVPSNRIPLECTRITPDMLPLLELTDDEIERVVSKVPGGVSNVQDMYPLSPLQEGIFFHYLMDNKSDPYLLSNMFAFDNRTLLDSFIEAMQSVVDRHDILRTSVVWEELPEPVQVVWRRADLIVNEVELDSSGDAAMQLRERFDPRHYRIDLSHAPLMHLFITRDTCNDRWLLLVLFHHLVGDHSTLDVMREEIHAHLSGVAEKLPPPIPFRNLVAQARLGVSREDHESFFREMLGDVDEPTAPFGLLDVQGDGSGIGESRVLVDSALSIRLRKQARRMGVSAASVCHQAWAQVVSRLTGCENVVFGTVLFGRMQGGAGADRGMGLFINTLPLKIIVGEAGVESSVVHTQRLLGDLMRHEHASLALAQRCSGVLAPAPLFTTLLNYRHSGQTIESSDLDSGPVWEGIESLWGEERTNYPLTLSVDDLGEGFSLTAQVHASIDPKRICDMMNKALACLVEALERTPELPVRTLDVLPEAERRLVVNEWNATETEYLSDKCVHELFEDQVSRTPEATAVVFGEESLTYAELNARANRLAHKLVELGVKPDSLVAICVERSLEMNVGLLGILKAGGAYVPLDPSYPKERLQFMLDDSKPSVLLTKEPMVEEMGLKITDGSVVVDLTHMFNEQLESNIEKKEIGLTSHHLAYVIYTSGSTGMPKGVMIEHAQVNRLFKATEAWYHFDEHDVWTLFHSYSFDFSVWELWGALLYGGRLVVVPRITVQSPDEFYGLVCREGVTVLNQTPSSFRQFIDTQVCSEERHQLRYVIFGGEALDVSMLRRWYECNGDTETLLVNMYGITETTVHVTYRALGFDDVEYRGGRSPIGSRIPDLRTYILDFHHQPVPIGATGELYIGGAGVARGYLNRPELTKDRFLPDPFSADPDGRMYKTGDLGRWLPDGTIEFLGRNDFQVKIRGFRIELGEIESRLLDHSDVREAVVIAREDEPGDKRLIAYVVSSVDLTAAKLRDHLSEYLPEYMVPSAFVTLESLPLTPNGKLDRKALPAPDGTSYITQEYEAPLGEVETKVAAIWEEVLSVERVGRHDNFFELGGHSLLAVKMIERMRRMGLNADVRALFNAPTLSRLAAATGSGVTEVTVPSNRIPLECTRITPDMLPLLELTDDEIERVVSKVPGGVFNVQDMYPLSPLQEGIFFHYLMDNKSDPYLLSSMFTFACRTLLDSFIEAMQSVVDRHDILRTSVVWDKLPEPVQVVWRRADLIVNEVELGSSGDAAMQLRERFDPRHYRIDLSHAPLMHLFITRDTCNDRWLLLVLFHHLVGDHSTLDVMQEEIHAHLSGVAEKLPPPIPFRNLVAQARLGVSREDHESFFREMLGDVDEPTAPFGLLDVQGDGSGVGESRVLVDSALSIRLRKQARRMGVSAASVCHQAWAQVVSRLTGCENVVFGTVLFGRMQGGAGADRGMGLFINTLPLKIIVGEAGVESSVVHTQRLLGDLMRHEHASLALAQRCSGVLAPAPLFTTLLNYRHSGQTIESSDLDSGPVWEGIESLWGEERTNYPLTLSVDDLGEGFSLTAQVHASIDPKRICDMMNKALTCLVEALERTPELSVRTLDILPEAERRLVVNEWNATETDYPSDKCVHELFEDQVAKTPEATAVVFGEESLTYAELNARANRLAHKLLELGVKPDSFVAICVERSLEMIVGLLGILKAGGAYVPLDPSYPKERLQFMLDDCNPSVLLTKEAMIEEKGLKITNGSVVVDLTLVSDEQPDSNIDQKEIALNSHHLAYVIYTSGSTGIPKGVMIEHRNTINLIHWAKSAIKEDVFERTLFSTSITFDLAIYELFVPLSIGAEVNLVQNLLTLAKKTVNVTLVNTVPSIMSTLLETKSVPEVMKMVNLAGEALKRELVERIFEMTKVDEVNNLYGPSETTTYSISVSMKRADGFSYVIGRPIANTRVYILDSHHQPVPIGATGELYISGAGVARGYLNRPELTEERFLSDPFSVDHDGRMYKTGDLGRWLPDGTIEFLGRNDFQVKIRGFRIELGEIESRLLDHSDVREAVVIAREDEPGDKRLIAYVVSSVDLTAAKLRDHLSEYLPEYMVPSAFVTLESLPLTPNGKLDRKALPAPDGTSYITRAYEAPLGEIETKVAVIWEEVLGVERVGRHDNFFELGGHSLLAVKMMSRLRQVLDIEVSLSDLFAHPILMDFSRELSNTTGTQLPRVTPSEHPDPIPLSFAQQRLWFLSQMDGVSEAYHIFGGMKLRGTLDRESLHRALNSILARHEALRTTFVQIDGEPFQRISSVEESTFQLLEQSVSDEDELQRLIETEWSASFDLEQGPLIRGRLIKEGDDLHTLLITMHHIVSDGWSMGVLVNEFSVLYNAYVEGKSNPLSSLEVQYADYAVWERRWISGDLLQGQAEYWKCTLSGAPELIAIPTDYPRPKEQDYFGGVVGLDLGEVLSRRLIEFSQREGVTLFMTLLSGWSALLSRLSGQSEVVIGTPSANRGRREIEDLIGFFVNTWALRIDVSGSPTVTELLTQVKTRMLEAEANQSIPFEHVVDLVNPVRSMSHSPVFQVMFAWQNNDEGNLKLTGLKHEPLAVETEAVAKFDLTLSLQEVDGRIVGGLEYATALYERETIERILGYYRMFLEGMLSEVNRPIDRLDILPETERHLVVNEWNATETDYPSDKCVHELFEDQVAKTPEATAVVFNDRKMTYKELNEKANSLAHVLRTKSEGRESIIGIIVERSFEMIIGMLAVLKSGAGYLPIDPDYPEDRIRYMLEECNAWMVLTGNGVIDKYSEKDKMLYGNIDIINMDNEHLYKEVAENPIKINKPADLAYVIYTSGSTGIPKGVLIEHRSIVNTLCWRKECYEFDIYDAVLQIPAFTFDSSVEDIFTPLISGSKLVLIQNDYRLDLNYLKKLIVINNVTHFLIVPSLYKIFLDDIYEDMAYVKKVTIAGEAFTRELVNEHFDKLKGVRLFNEYGPTENSVCSTVHEFSPECCDIIIGKPIFNTNCYVLDKNKKVIPVGIIGEIYIGGAGVARGYLNHPELTKEHFLPDPFSADIDSRMYKTGDLGRWLPDGTIEFLGRNDFQVKIRGFRIELGEIESRLLDHSDVREAVVIAREDEPGDKHLIAYVVSSVDLDAETLRDHLSEHLPEYMVPSAFVTLESFPLTPNGKLDRKALPAPDGTSYVTRGYEAPLGEVETKVAAIWEEVLGVERVGRHDNFFKLGGHSLLAVKMIERMRRMGLTADVRALFNAPTLSGLAAAAGSGAGEVIVPANGIPFECTRITSEMLPLLELTDDEIERVVSTVPGGVSNVQDMYPLSPLQEGIFFHHLMEKESDPYLLSNRLAFDNRTLLDSFIEAMQSVVDRHDILRTSVVWEELPEPVQVVWRRADLIVNEVELDSSGDAAMQLRERFDPRHYRIDLSHAPLMHLFITRDTCNDRWLLLVLFHHLVGDHSTLDVMQEEIHAHLSGVAEKLPPPIPFRNLVAQARLGVSREDHESFFREMLGDVDEPTAPFGLLDVQGDGSGIGESRVLVDSALSIRLRKQARRMGVSAASVCHQAWAQVVSRLTGCENVVFGTVLFGRMQGGAGADRGMGLFINTLPLKIIVGEAGVESSVVHTQRLLGDLMRHEHASLALAQRCSGVLAPAPLFTTLLNYRHSGQTIELSDLDSRPVWEGIESLWGEERTNYPLTLSVDDLGEDFSLTAKVHASIDPKRICDMMNKALTCLVEALERTPELSVRTLDVLPEAERHLVVNEWNATETDYPSDKCVHELFEDQVSRTPEATAVVFGEESLTYAELNARANRLAHKLLELGVKPDSLVAICVERSLEMIVGLLGILKAGGAYVPLDPSYPKERLQFMLNDCESMVMLTRNNLLENLKDIFSEELTIVDLDQHFEDRPETNTLSNTFTSSHLAYVIYTSGSTGIPKGVMIKHKGVSNQCVASQTLFNLRPGERFLQFANVTFDVSVQEIFSTLISGATVILRTDVRIKGAKSFWEECRNNRITILHLPTRFWQTIINEETVELPDCIRLLVIGGEAVEVKALRNWFKYKCKKPTLFNSYGPTEVTVNATLHTLTHNIGTWRSIGSSINNTRVYILNTHCQPVPVGVIGELYIGGAGVARGYLNRPELTEERFLADPFCGDPDSRMYKTGDLGRWLPDGTIEFLGRNDFQVKIRGFRIELGEIESRLLDHSDVREAVVIAREDEPGDKRLIAYVVSSVDLTAAKLRDHLSEYLPEYMVPSAFVTLESLPLTPNGKLDRKALPAPDGTSYITQEYEAPLGEVETKVAAIWEEVLSVERVGRHDNFFELGGHSLLAVKMIERMRRLGLNADVRTLFNTPTLLGLAAATGSGVTEVTVPSNRIPLECTRITPDMLPLLELTDDEIERVVSKVPGGVSNVQDMYPLSPLQEGIFFHYLMDNKSDPYLLSNMFAFDNRTLLDSFIEAMQSVVDRHDILRTSVVWEELPEPVQVVWRRADLIVNEVELDSSGDAAMQLRERFDPRHYRIDLSHAPLMHLFITRDTCNDRWLLLVLFHHLVGDHSTLDVMREEIHAHLSGVAEKLPPPIPFRNLVAQARLGVSREDHESFFREMLGDVDEPTAPFGLLDVQGDGSGIGESRVLVDSALSIRLRKQARRMGVSAASVCHQAWAQVVSRLTGCENVVFGTVLFGRMQGGAGADRGMGLFINTLPLKIIVGEAGVESSVVHTQRLLGDLMRHEHASLALAQRCSGVLAPAPLFTTLLNYRHSGQTIESSDLDSGPVWEGIESLWGEERTNYPLTLSVDDLGEGFSLTAQVHASIDPKRICDMMNKALACLVEALERTPELSVRTLDVLPEAERRLVVNEWNATETEYLSDKCVHELFEDQVSRTPEATAVVFGEESLTYAELNARANRLAHKLVELGVKPDSLVAICVERSLEMNVGLLGILKAGGAYVPLDPSYPKERLQFMLDDSKPSVLLTKEPMVEEMGLKITDGSVVVDLTHMFNEQLESNIEKKEIGLTSHHLAYVIYTSGSTGMPKGVMIEHAQVNRLFKATEAWYHFDEHDVWTLFHSYSFDFSVWELWGALLYGGRLVVVPRITVQSPDEFYGLVCREGVTVLNQTPSSFRQFIDTQVCSEERHQLRYVIFGGEALDVSMLRRWYECNGDTETLLVNMYGITETTVHVTYRALGFDDVEYRGGRSPIGSRIPDLRTYILDFHHQPVPIGATGELYIGGAGVARGYLNRPELTKDRFLPDPFSADPDGRMYKTGDLGRWLPDGTIEFLGRNDFQVKIRGFRIELGEIESRLLDHSDVREAVVIAREDEPGDKRLVAYVVSSVDLTAETLRDHLSEYLPEYMVPSAFVALKSLPLTPNGKLDRKALPAPDGTSYITQEYEAPLGEVETKVAAIWEEVLSVERVGRHDNFFELGGHSLLAVKMIERMRRLGLNADVRTLFNTPTLLGLAAATGSGVTEVTVPSNRIPLECTRITPDMLPLLELTDDEIERVVSKVPGGVSNVQDMYPLSPLQEGIFFHYLMDNKSDPYLLSNMFAFDNRTLLDSFIEAMQSVVDRHDILRTSVVWEELPEPVQVVWRRADLIVNEVELDSSGDAAMQLCERFDPRHYRIDLSHAPLMHLFITRDTCNDRWLLLVLFHHLVGDHSTLDVMREEIHAHLSGFAEKLPPPIPFRNLVAQARLGVSREDHESFFREMLGDVDEPTAPFGLLDVQGDGSGIGESRVLVDSALSIRLRKQARRMGVSAASVCHQAWAQVVSRLTGCENVVFGTVLFGRMQGGAGADRGMGLFINTLPLKIIVGEAGVESSVVHTQRLLGDLMRHEHASLALAQRCSGVLAPAPLFTTLLNYRHSGQTIESSDLDSGPVWEGIESLWGEERTNYPLTLSVDDLGEGFSLTAQVHASIDPKRICDMMNKALACLVEALERTPELPVRTLDILPETERHLVVNEWNATETDYPSDKCVHELFEDQVAKTPEATAVVFGEESLTYAELNARANRLAHKLLELGVKPDNFVAICVERSLEMIVGLLGILKAGGAYVPLDPSYPKERLQFMLDDCNPSVLLTKEAMIEEKGLKITNGSVVVDLTLVSDEQPDSNIDQKEIALNSHHLAYVIYTSGSTGIPKGVMIEHRNTINLIHWAKSAIKEDVFERTLFSTSITFDLAIYELFVPLSIGAEVNLVQNLLTLAKKNC